jgi:hypothetical protein
VQYRLAQMDPEPSLEPVLTRPDEVPMSRVSVMRAEMGLAADRAERMARFMEAAFDDVAEAVRFVEARHGDYGIDPERIVLGGVLLMPLTASVSASLESFPSPDR